MIIRRALIIAALAALAFSAATAAETTAKSEPEATIEYLLAHVAASDRQFVRNGKTHSGAEAVKHMRRKYEYYSDRIHSPEEFIQFAATKSMMSGKAYMVRNADGEIPTAKWLHEVLAEYRVAHEGHDGGSK